MPPKKSRRLSAAAHDEQSNSANEPDPNANLALVQLPPELFDAIIDNYATLPSTFYRDTAEDTPKLEYYERSDALTALSQTCRALRNLTLPRLWTRLDICRVPEAAKKTWYKYVMLEMERKANGIAVSPVRVHVRTLTLLFSKSQPGPALAALWKMLPALPNLRQIHVINCRTPGFAKSLDNPKLELPSVTTLFLPNEASVIQRICPNTTHVRCVGGPGAALISALTDKTEIFDGMADWTDMKIVDRLVKKAPNLRTLEIRRPVNNGLGIQSQNKVPEEWPQIFPRLAGLKKLAELIVTFPAAEERAVDLASLKAARALLQKSTFKGERRLTIRRVIAPHYENSYTVDFVHSVKTEIFDDQ
ncbi:hypothetical protein C8J56DRAFT_459703 [Mycena floridula]|nr:hypothetical protein C8J56DRAFT_459703 [Mycena floridula]